MLIICSTLTLLYTVHIYFSNSAVISTTHIFSVSDNLGLVDFAGGLEDSVLCFPDGQLKFFGENFLTEVL